MDVPSIARISRSSRLSEAQCPFARTVRQDMQAAVLQNQACLRFRRRCADPQEKYNSKRNGYAPLDKYIVNNNL